MGETHPADPSDLAGFLAALDRMVDGPLHDFFRADEAVTIARAPGRIDLMGGIADYSGSLVLQWPMRLAAFAAVQLGSPAGGFDAASLDAIAPEAPPRRATIDGATWRRLLGREYAEVRDALGPDQAWAAYPAGVALVLAREAGLPAAEGVRVVLWSHVPEGKGVSSSAAIEVATAQALLGAAGLDLDGARLASYCQQAENHAVGAPCGIMDQMTSALGREHQLLALLCQPATIEGFVPLPDSIGIWGIDSGIRHAVSGSDYTSVRVGAFMGYRIIADLAGLGPFPGKTVGRVYGRRPGETGRLRQLDPRWRGYLANVTPEELDREFATHLPETMSGSEFLARYGGTTDPVTRVDPARTYAVRQPTAHPIRENACVRRFAALLGGQLDEAGLVEMGRLMFESHASYSACGLGSDGTDRLVRLVRDTGPAAGLYGAKITGGGSGGTVAVLGRADAEEAVAAVATRYRDETGHPATIFAGSSPGAVAFGTRRVRLGRSRAEVSE